MKTFNLNYRGKDHPEHTEKSIMRALPGILATMTPTDKIIIAIEQKVVETDKSVIVPIVGKVTG